jgi:hydroxymethylbilane synthase
VTGRNGLRIATRGSALALWQAHAVAERLQAAGVSCDIVVIRTSGDQRPDVRGAEGDTKRQFVKELEDALIRGDVDLAVHSAKDLPVVLPDGLAIAACLPRADPRDAIVLPRGEPPRDLAAILARLNGGSTLGTGSARRIAQLASLVPRARFEPIRGNVDTRLAKLDSGKVDALVLASAGLERLGFGPRISAAVPVEQCVPAPGQGIVAIEIRAGDARTRAGIESIHDRAAGESLAAERALVSSLGGGCQLPLGAIALPRHGALEMHAVVASLDGSRKISGSMTGPSASPEALGERLAATLAHRGARELLSES